MADVPNWIDNPLAWSTVYIGLAELPGVATVRQIKCGPKLDRQKRRKTEGVKLKDDGMKPAEFAIELWMNAAEWSRWLAILPFIHSVKPGNPREPKQIVHPLPNMMGINQIYVKAVAVESPTARNGCKAVIEVEQWFAEIKQAKPKTQVTPVKYLPQGGRQISDRLSYDGRFLPGEPEGLDAIEQGIYRADATFHEGPPPPPPEE